jgi:hypothetical protein
MYSDTIFLLYFRFLSCSNGVSYISFAYFIPEFFSEGTKSQLLDFQICTFVLWLCKPPKLKSSSSILFVWLFVCLFVWWCLTPLSTIFQLYRGGQFLLEEDIGGPGENHWLAASHWQTSSHNVVSSRPLAMKVILTHIVGGYVH